MRAPRQEVTLAVVLAWERIEGSRRRSLEAWAQVHIRGWSIVYGWEQSYFVGNREVRLQVRRRSARDLGTLSLNETCKQPLSI